MLRCENITRVRNHVPIFEPISFQLAAGQCCYLQGGNGSGKTTLLRILAGLSPFQGQYTINPSEQHQVGTACAMLGHQHGLYDSLTVVENIETMGLWYQSPVNHMTFGLHDAPWLTGLNAADLVGSLSAGQKQKLAWLRLLISGAPVWLLDEPLSHLDGAAQQLALATLSAHLQAGGVAVLATHRPDFWQSLIGLTCDLSAVVGGANDDG